jgi:hypothetical protein
MTFRRKRFSIKSGKKINRYSAKDVITDEKSGGTKAQPKIVVSMITFTALGMCRIQPWAFSAVLIALFKSISGHQAFSHGVAIAGSWQ